VQNPGLELVDTLLDPTPRRQKTRDVLKAPTDHERWPSEGTQETYVNSCLRLTRLRCRYLSHVRSLDRALLKTLLRFFLRVTRSSSLRWALLGFGSKCSARSRYRLQSLKYQRLSVCSSLKMLGIPLVFRCHPRLNTSVSAPSQPFDQPDKHLPPAPRPARSQMPSSGLMPPPPPVQNHFQVYQPQIPALSPSGATMSSYPAISGSQRVQIPAAGSKTATSAPNSRPS
jgi:hypothetical protein